MKTLEADVTELSRPLPTGDWFFHICAVDLVGNWGAVETAGPVSVDDSIDPEVVRIDTVASSPDGRLLPGESTEVAVTQLLIEFSEGMAAGVTVPANYRLLAPGADESLDASSCADGGDEPVTIDEVLYDEASWTAALELNGGLSLPAGPYRLLVCDSLSDLSGNPLAGGGDLVLLDFRVVGDNLLRNPNFDDDLASWAASEDLVADFSTDDADRAFSSGSAELEVLAEPASFGQCVELSDASSLRLSGRVRIEQLGTEAPEVVASLTWYSDPACGGTGVASADATGLVGGTGGLWEPFLIANAPRPAGVQSVLVSVLVVPGEADGQAIVGVDSLSCVDLSVLFSDGFESGDLGAWSRSVDVP